MYPMLKVQFVTALRFVFFPLLLYAHRSSVVVREPYSTICDSLRYRASQILECLPAGMIFQISPFVDRLKFHRKSCRNSLMMILVMLPAKRLTWMSYHFRLDHPMFLRVFVDHPPDHLVVGEICKKKKNHSYHSVGKNPEFPPIVDHYRWRRDHHSHSLRILRHHRRHSSKRNLRRRLAAVDARETHAHPNTPNASNLMHIYHWSPLPVAHLADHLNPSKSQKGIAKMITVLSRLLLTMDHCLWHCFLEHPLPQSSRGLHHNQRVPRSPYRNLH
mmetsp:Transcript_22737/g.53907  ORF Transcript_22737/g.53907 Transcript_22737/m.53907 type:complete len:274 (-) Transcript_22737:486-1307(-)